jgi:hypothetical protein
METFPLNNLAEKFEVDRSIMVRAVDPIGDIPAVSVWFSPHPPLLRSLQRPGR